VIVRAAPGSTAVAARAVRTLGGHITRAIPLINGFAATVPQLRAGSLRRSAGVVDVTTDGPVRMAGESYDAHHDHASLFNLENMIGARTMWNHYTGAGVGVAVVDSGVTPVPGLSSADKVVNGPDLTEESQDPSTAHLDTYGHGTQMAAIIAGHDADYAARTNQGNARPFLGLAPDARIVSVKVADAHGMTDVSQVLAGVDWVVQHAHDDGLNIRVMNLSFGTNSSQSYLVDPLAFAVEQAWLRGIVVVASAGNTGNSLGHLSDPAIDPFVIAVGADDLNGTPDVKDDDVASFSARGDGRRNPDVLAPGMHVQSLRVSGSYIDEQHAGTGGINSRYFRGSGTSQAAAMVSGAAALLIQEHPAFSPDAIKSLLVSTARPLKGYAASAQGNGLLDLRAASAPQKQPLVAPTYPHATGGGSIEGTRGGLNEIVRGSALSGDQDIFGQSIDTASLATAEASGDAWSGGSWNRSQWAGTDWSSSSWSTCAWDGTDWTGSSWSADSWSSGSWTGSSWSGSSWSDDSWKGSSWSGSSWSDDGWTGGPWSTDEWS
jgi:serine protease AprX